ncbi:hypothetical protein [Cyanobium sp. Morenito 9A2]|uniref:hypothetical protein n=1 Tax=Cyanobium sp. Morenito 9A2 TaxID=2823718 RepID=UPI0020CE94BD|nr:hypothetical protein [Cyanobium sp. Morenito 9A2]MCP9850385.1 hypothetical protein [Cyanobium sp. Morenito 9A2]
MKRTLPTLAACLVLAALPTGIAAARDPVVALRSGSSFGHCVGYCDEELELVGTRGRYERRAWRAPTGTTLAPQILRTSVPQQTWLKLVRLADNLQLTKPQVVIGCPDCDDGGSEWIELVRQSGAKRRIVFEYHRYPANAEALGPQLAALRETLAKASAARGDR